AEVARGRELYMAQGCNACHTLDGSASAGPTWKGLWGSRVALEGGGEVTADEAYIKESIREPNAKVVNGFPPTMPSFTNLSDEDVAAIVALIRSLGSDGSGH
ncbi:MAG: cytochrome c, partial [Clostridia bacterium]|nr:cytochrome c [Clostridia bacterium]